MSQNSNLPSGRARSMTFRLLAILCGLLPFAILEGVLTLAGWGSPESQGDPFSSFAGVRPLFEKDASGERYEIAQSRRDWFYPDSFPVEKGVNTFRVFCIGASTVAGRPYTKETAFSTWLRMFLEFNAPERNWEMVNCGGVSYASYRLAPIVEEVLKYEPDLLILYTGHNEFLEDRTYSHLKNLPEAVIRPYEWASHLRSFNVLRRAVLSIKGQPTSATGVARPILPEEVDALLEHEGGIEQYFRDPGWHDSVFEQYRFNLNRMLWAAKKAKVPVIVMNPACNIRNTRPFKSEHSFGLTQEQLDEFDELVSSASTAGFGGEYERAAELYEDAGKIDPGYADVLFDAGNAYNILQQFSSALPFFEKAKDEDICPLRMLSPMHDILRDVTVAQGGHFLDVRREVYKVSTDGIPGDDGFLDHVHPNPAGHQFFAKLLIEEMEKLGYVKLKPKWMEGVIPEIQEYLSTLSADYWADGEMRLQNLRHWAQGQSKSEPPVTPKRQRPASNKKG